jgi:hypothetical protein
MKFGNNQKNIAVGGKTVFGGTVGVCMLGYSVSKNPWRYS